MELNYDMDAFIEDKRVSDLFIKAIEKQTIPKDFQKTINTLREKSKQPFRINLSGTKMKDESLRMLHRFPVYELDLNDCQNLTIKSLKIIAEIPTLKVLKLSGNRWVNDEVLAAIPDQIVDLSISFCNDFTKKGLESLGRTSVRVLDLAGCDQLKDEDFTSLPTHLEGLDLRFCDGVGDKTLKMISKMRELTTLVLASTSVGDKQIDHLPKQLVSLDLAGCNLSDRALEPISHMQKLHRLNLSGSNITDEGVSKIPKSVRWIALNLCRKLTDKGIVVLAHRKTLEFVALYSTPKITSKGIKKFNRNVDVGWVEPQPAHQALNAFTK